jgi:adenylate kinase family enzyme
MTKPIRIFIVGGAGSGKSTFARVLAKKAGLPLHHMDQLFWKPGWKTSDVIKKVFDRRIKQIAWQKKWILEGAYKRSLPTVLKRAEAVVYLDTSPWVCAIRVIKRWVSHFVFRSPRPDLPEGCTEQVDLGFVREAFEWRKRQMPEILALVGEFGDRKRLHLIRNAREADRFLREHS